MRSSLVLATILAIPPCLLQAESVPRKTGNMTITSYRTPLMKGQQPNPLDPMLRDPEKLKRFGFSSIEDYVTLDVIEPQKGKFNFAPHLANAKACRRYGFKYAIYPWVHFYPDWVETEPGFTRYTNLEDGSTCRQPSGWAPFTTKLMEHFYRVMAEHLGEYVDAVYVTDCAEYGELGYPNGYTKWLRPDENAKVAWWCGDKCARADFRRRMLKTHESLETLNAAWGTGFKDKREITYPPIELLKSNPDPCKLTPKQRRWILDFVYWYQDSSARRVKEYIEIARKYFPGKLRRYEVKLGHADERAIMGHSYSSACRILNELHEGRLAIRSTHASVSYFHVKRAATPMREIGFRLLTEPPGTVKPKRMAERLFTDACSGVTEYFDYPQNPQTASATYNQYIGLLDRYAPWQRFVWVEVGLFFPEADHYLRIDKTYPEGLLACAAAIRDVADFDVLDERLIDLGYGWPVLVIVGDPIIENATWEHLKTFGRREASVQIVQIVEKEPPYPAGSFVCVDGTVRSIINRDSKWPKQIHRVIDKPDGEKAIAAVRQAYAQWLTDASIARKVPEACLKLLTAQDGVWTSLFTERIPPERKGERDGKRFCVLAYNTSDKECMVNGKPLGGRSIAEFAWDHPEEKE